MKQLLALCLLIPCFVYAKTLPTADQIKQKVSTTLGIKVNNISESPIDHLYQIMTDQGIFYVSEDGTKIVSGKVFDLDNKLKNLTEAALIGPRKEIVDSLQNLALVYKAKNERHIITVFTDITCGYCQKLHSEIDTFLNNGVSVHYLAYPRTGFPSDSASALESVWCSDNPQLAFTNAMQDRQVTPKTCPNAKIEKQYLASRELNLAGTPAIILEDGTLIPGYQEAIVLIKALDEMAKSK